MTRVRDPLAASDERHVAERKAGRQLQPAERDLLDEREDVALEGGEVNELAMLLVPLRCLSFASDVRFGTTGCRRTPVRRINARLFRLLDSSTDPASALAAEDRLPADKTSGAATHAESARRAASSTKVG